MGGRFPVSYPSLLYYVFYDIVLDNRMKIKNKRPFYHEGLQFECTRCGGCCSGFPGFVWLSETDVDRLLDHLKIDRSDFIASYSKVVRGFGQPRLSLIEKEEFACIFFDDEPGHICTVYEARPYQCRSYPFWGKNLVSRSEWEKTADFCPGVNRGRTYYQKEIEGFLNGIPEYNIKRFNPSFRAELGY
jgi:Fe-S-cluster containining protein